MMEVGTQVTHRREGAGTVIKTGLASQRVKVEFESGVTKVLAESRLRVVPQFTLKNGDDAPAEPPATRKRDRGVPYDEMERAVEALKREYPEADKVEAKWYGGRVYCEVWTGGRADIVFVKGA